MRKREIKREKRQRNIGKRERNKERRKEVEEGGSKEARKQGMDGEGENGWGRKEGKYIRGSKDEGKEKKK